MKADTKPKNKKTETILVRLAAVAFAIFTFFVAYQQPPIGNYSNPQTIKFLQGLISALLVVAAYAAIEIIMNFWQSIISKLLVFFGRHPSVRPWFILPGIVGSVLFPIYNLRNWKMEVTLFLLIILYLVFLLPAALISLLRDDMRFEKTQLGKEISRNIQAQNPQAAIGHAFTYFENRLRERIPNSTKLYGRRLIQTAFGGNSSYLVYITDGKDRTTDLFNLVSGAYSLFRNPRHHKIIDDDLATAQTLLPFIDLLIKFVDETEEREKIETIVSEN